MKEFDLTSEISTACGDLACGICDVVTFFGCGGRARIWADDAEERKRDGGGRGVLEVLAPLFSLGRVLRARLWRDAGLALCGRAVTGRCGEFLSELGRCLAVSNLPGGQVQLVVHGDVMISSNADSLWSLFCAALRSVSSATYML